MMEEVKKGKLREGFSQLTSLNMPKVKEWTVAEFFAGASFVEPELRHQKTERSARPSYADNAVGWVQIKRQGSNCEIWAEITPEHKVRSQSYAVHCILEENEEDEAKILRAYCLDCAASAGGCKHAVAFVMWLYRKAREPATTETSCYWKKAKLSTVGTTLKFCTVEMMAPNPRKEQAAFSQEKKDRFFEELSNLFPKRQETVAFSQQLKRKESYSVHHLLMNFLETDGPKDGSNFLRYCSSSMDKKTCEKLTKATVKQAASGSLWFDLRYGRITASTFHEAAKCDTEDGSLVKKILGAVNFKSSDAMIRGQNLEGQVLKVVASRRKGRITKVGLILKNEAPIFGASPDGLIGDHIIEIKCPSSSKTYETYFQENRQPANKFKAQMMLQMFFTGKKKGLFCVADPKFEENAEVEISEVLYDEEYCKNLLDEAEKFWLKCMFPVLVKHLEKT